MLQLGQHQPGSNSGGLGSPACGNTGASTAVPAAINGVPYDGACDEDEDEDENCDSCGKESGGGSDFRTGGVCN